VIRLSLFPLSAGLKFRSARRMRIAQPVHLQKRQAEIKARHASDPKKQQEELGKADERNSAAPWPVLSAAAGADADPVRASFATFAWVPFADVLPYTLNLRSLRG